MIFNAKATFVAFLFLLLGLGACNDRPSPAGANFIYDTLAVYAVATPENPLISSTVSAAISEPLFNSGSLFIGKSGDVEGFSMMRFVNIPDSLTTLQESDIISAKLTMNPLNYAYGNTTANVLAFSVVKVLKEWLNTTTLDSIKALNVGGSMFDSKILASFNEQIPYNSTTATTITMDFDKATLIDWFRKQSDSASRRSVYGIAFLPNPSCTVVRTFSTQLIGGSEDQLSKLQVIYKKAGKETPDTLMLQSGFDGSFVSAAPQPKNQIMTQGGVKYRTRFMFDLSKIPPLSAIHRAEISLTWDSLSSVLGTSGAEPRMLLRLATDTTFKQSSSSVYYGNRTEGTNTYLFQSISSAVERWLRGEANYGLILHAETAPEYDNCNRMVFYGLNAADSTKRPKLIIVYSKRTQGQ